MRSEEEIRNAINSIEQMRDTFVIFSGKTNREVDETIATLKWVLNEQDDKVH